jgi:hypothetical protein
LFLGHTLPDQAIKESLGRLGVFVSQHRYDLRPLMNLPRMHGLPSDSVSSRIGTGQIDTREMPTARKARRRWAALSKRI